MVNYASRCPDCSANHAKVSRLVLGNTPVQSHPSQCRSTTSNPTTTCENVTTPKPDTRASIFYFDL